MPSLRRPVMGLQDTPRSASPAPPPPPGMGPGGAMAPPMTMSIGSTAGQFTLPGTPDITASDTAAGGQTNMAMMDQLRAMLGAGASPQDAIQAISQTKS